MITSDNGDSIDAAFKQGADDRHFAIQVVVMTCNQHRSVMQMQFGRECFDQFRENSIVDGWNNQTHRAAHAIVQGAGYTISDIAECFGCLFDAFARVGTDHFRIVETSRNGCG